MNMRRQYAVILLFIVGCEKKASDAPGGFQARALRADEFVQGKSVYASFHDLPACNEIRDGVQVFVTGAGAGAGAGEAPYRCVGNTQEWTPMQGGVVVRETGEKGDADVETEKYRAEAKQAAKEAQDALAQATAQVAKTNADLGAAKLEFEAKSRAAETAKIAAERARDEANTHKGAAANSAYQADQRALAAETARTDALAAVVRTDIARNAAIVAETNSRDLRNEVVAREGNIQHLHAQSVAIHTEVENLQREAQDARDEARRFRTSAGTAAQLALQRQQVAEHALAAARVIEANVVTQLGLAQRAAHDTHTVVGEVRGLRDEVTVMRDVVAASARAADLSEVNAADSVDFARRQAERAAQSARDAEAERRAADAAQRAAVAAQRDAATSAALSEAKQAEAARQAIAARESAKEADTSAQLALNEATRSAQQAADARRAADEAFTYKNEAVAIDRHLRVLAGDMNRLRVRMEELVAIADQAKKTAITEAGKARIERRAVDALAMQVQRNLQAAFQQVAADQADTQSQLQAAQLLMQQTNTATAALQQAQRDFIFAQATWDAKARAVNLALAEVTRHAADVATAEASVRAAAADVQVDAQAAADAAQEARNQQVASAAHLRDAQIAATRAGNALVQTTQKVREAKAARDRAIEANATAQQAAVTAVGAKNEVVILRDEIRTIHADILRLQGVAAGNAADAVAAATRVQDAEARVTRLEADAAHAAGVQHALAAQALVDARQALAEARQRSDDTDAQLRLAQAVVSRQEDLAARMLLAVGGVEAAERRFNTAVQAMHDANAQLTRDLQAAQAAVATDAAHAQLARQGVDAALLQAQQNLDTAQQHLVGTQTEHAAATRLLTDAQSTMVAIQREQVAVRGFTDRAETAARDAEQALTAIHQVKAQALAEIAHDKQAALDALLRSYQSVQQQQTDLLDQMNRNLRNGTISIEAIADKSDRLAQDADGLLRQAMALLHQVQQQPVAAVVAPPIPAAPASPPAPVVSKIRKSEAIVNVEWGKGFSPDNKEDPAALYLGKNGQGHASYLVAISGKSNTHSDRVIRWSVVNSHGDKYKGNKNGIAIHGTQKGPIFLRQNPMNLHEVAIVFATEVADAVWIEAHRIPNWESNLEIIGSSSVLKIPKSMEKKKDPGEPILGDVYWLQDHTITAMIYSRAALILDAIEPKDQVGIWVRDLSNPSVDSTNVIRLKVTSKEGNRNSTLRYLPCLMEINQKPFLVQGRYNWRSAGIHYQEFTGENGKVEHQFNDETHFFCHAEGGYAVMVYNKGGTSDQWKGHWKLESTLGDFKSLHAVSFPTEPNQSKYNVPARNPMQISLIKKKDGRPTFMLFQRAKSPAPLLLHNLGNSEDKTFEKYENFPQKTDLDTSGIEPDLVQILAGQDGDYTILYRVQKSGKTDWKMGINFPLYDDNNRDPHP